MLESVDNFAADGDREHTIAETLFRRLSDAIVSGELQAGAKLSEPILARQYGVSRGPLREALNRLQERRLVTRSAHVGARVAKLSAEVLEEAFVVREALEGMAARQAACNATPEDVAALRRACARHVSAAKEGGEGPVWRTADEDFHVLVARASHNPMLLRLLTEDLYQLVRFYRSRLVHIRGRGPRTITEHMRVLEAIEDKDGEMAELHMRRHVASARAVWSAALREKEESTK